MPTNPHEAAIKLDETANEHQHKVELYFVGLVFTIAGLAIQSAKPTGITLQWWTEIFAWSLLIASGIFGLLRLLDAPSLFRIRSNAQSIQAMRGDVAGKIIDEQLKELNGQYETTTTRMGWYAKARTALFLVGIVLLAAARAWTGFLASSWPLS